MCLSDSCGELLLFVPRTFSARGRLVAGVSGQIPARCSVVVKSGEMSGETKIAALNEEPTRQETGAGVKSQDSREPRQNGMRLVRLHCRIIFDDVALSPNDSGLQSTGFQLCSPFILLPYSFEYLHRHHRRAQTLPISLGSATIRRWTRTRMRMLPCPTR